MKPEQRAILEETHGLEMPRQGVSLLNESLGLGRHCTRRAHPTKTLDNINRLTQPRLPTPGNNVSTPERDP